MAVKVIRADCQSVTPCLTVRRAGRLIECLQRGGSR
jgi:hypothetical protein